MESEMNRADLAGRLAIVACASRRIERAIAGRLAERRSLALVEGVAHS